MNKFSSTRRDFLKTMGQVSLVMLANGSIVTSTLAQTEDPMIQHNYTGWENFHREQWTWDKKTRGTHLVNCTGSCPHFVYTKNGVVMREEQSKDTPKLNGIPEYNPRGCNKGDCASDYIYSPHRIKYPLIRVGERGEGKWRRVSWDEALEYAANGNGWCDFHHEIAQPIFRLKNGIKQTFKVWELIIINCTAHDPRFLQNTKGGRDATLNHRKPR